MRKCWKRSLCLSGKAPDRCKKCGSDKLNRICVCPLGAGVGDGIQTHGLRDHKPISMGILQFRSLYQVPDFLQFLSERQCRILHKIFCECRKSVGNHNSSVGRTDVSNYSNTSGHCQHDFVSRRGNTAYKQKVILFFISFTVISKETAGSLM